MQNNKTVCICGGGGLGHTIAANISSKGYQVNLLTGHPTQWHNQIEVTDSRGATIMGHITNISNRPEDVIPQSNIILLCVPGYLIQQTLRQIAPFINKGMSIGSVVCSNGFFWIAQNILSKENSLFGFQRVPYISRVTEYGKKADLKGYKSQLKIGGNKNCNLKELASFFSISLNTPTVTLNHYLEATLTNSNPILHPARIYGMLSPFTTSSFDKEFLFYEEWDDFSSEILIKCDEEFQRLLSLLPINQAEIPSILTYYESVDASSLTQKIRSIEAFKGIKMNMISEKNQFRIDYTNRYFTEDIPYGLLIIKSLADLLQIKTPTIDTVIHWMQNRMNKEYLIGADLIGKDIQDSGIIQNYNIKTLEELYKL